MISLRKKSLKSLTGKLIIAIGSMMLIVGLFFSFIFIKQNPDIKLRIILVYGIFFIISLSVPLCLILYYLVTKPISQLIYGMNRLSTGDLDYRIDINTKDEIGLLAKSFNSMADDLQQYRKRMEDWTKTLEDEIQKKTAEIVRAQEQLVNAEKLASLGRMAAGVAHELNSPLTGILTFAHLIKNRIPAGNTQDLEDINTIIEQAERCSKIVKGLLGFARKAESEMTKTNINSLIENTVSMVRNQSKFYNINFSINLDKTLPEVLIDANQIQQVFLNLLLNAADAMEEKGNIIIETRTIEDDGKKFIEIEFTDTGPGIPEEIKDRIFEPFFTTKPTGKGTGLGLSVSYGIIKKHKGEIFVKSEYGRGASFFVRLPLEVK